MTLPRIFIDADACPVKDEVYRVAARYGLHVFVVSNGWINTLRQPWIEQVVVDAGPDPALVDSCLDRLGVSSVPLLVLTHFHADHVDGLPGVLEDREVGELLVTRQLDPPEGVDDVLGISMV